MDQRNAALEQELLSTIDRKNTKEMEQFAGNFSALKLTGAIECPLFSFDLSYIDQATSEVGQLIERYGGALPRADDPLSMQRDKWRSLRDALQSRGDESVTLSALLDVAREIQFDEDELLLIELHVRLVAVPDCIDVAGFLKILRCSLIES
jgi:hypothetical protein